MYSEFLSNIFIILLLADPLGNAPIFLALLKNTSTQRRRIIILREHAIALGVLVLFILLGDGILALFHLSDEALEISGGIILFLLALRMTSPKDETQGQQVENTTEPFIVPLAIPLIAGPASLATMVLAASKQESILPLIAAAVSAMAISAMILLVAERIAQLFGKTGMQALERLMGLILTTVAVQMLISGIGKAIKALN